MSDDDLKRAIGTIKRHGHLGMAMLTAELGECYFVEAGDYSDYHVKAVFLERAEAEAYAEQYNAHETYEHASVEPRPLSVVDSDHLGGCYAVNMDADGNSVDGAKWSNYWSVAEKSRKWRNKTGYIFGGFGKTPEHAMRSANELRRKTLSESP